MKFCPQCESRLILVSEKGRLLFQCERCGYREIASGEEKLERRRNEDSVIVIERNKDVRTLPEVATVCPRCGNRKAFWWTVQTRGADESPTQFFRCTKCGYTWRVD